MKDENESQGVDHRTENYVRQKSLQSAQPLLKRRKEPRQKIVHELSPHAKITAIFDYLPYV